MTCCPRLRKKGASTQIIQLLAGFLGGRQMIVKVGKGRSAPRPVNAGAPRGSVLGAYLFNIGTDDLEEGAPIAPLSLLQHPEYEELPGTGQTSTPRWGAGPGQGPPTSPVPDAAGKQDFELLPNVVNPPGWIRAPQGTQVEREGDCVLQIHGR